MNVSLPMPITSVGTTKQAPRMQTQAQLSAASRSISKASNASSARRSDRRHKSMDVNVEWRVAVDPRTKRPYYYHPITRETTWRKPQQLIDKEKREKVAFFSAMERNILSKLRAGHWFRSSPSEDLASRNSDVGPRPPTAEELELNSTEMMASKKVEEPESPDSIDEEPPNNPHRMLFRTLSSYETPVPYNSKKDGKVSSVPSPIEERVRMATCSSASDVLNMSDDTLERRSLDGRPMVEPKVHSRGRSNSTGTIFVRNGTISAPHQESTVQCVATLLRAHMVEARAKPVQLAPEFQVFCRSLRSSSNEIPSLKQIASLIKRVFQKAQMESECLIMSLVYVERLLQNTSGRLQLRTCNWRAILFCSMMMASKVWDDLSMSNADFAKILPTLHLKEINDLEMAYLSAVEYNVRVSAVSYAKYYFHLRTVSNSMGMLAAFDQSAPLNLDGARKMQVLSEEYEERSKLMPATRRRSATIAATTSSAPGYNKDDSSIRRSNVEARKRDFLGSKPSPAATLEQLVRMQVRSAGGATFSPVQRASLV